MRIVVAGGTGAVGRYVVQAAHDAGHQVTAISRRTGVDVRTGAGLADALRGVDVIIDTTQPDTLSRARASAFFTEVGATLHTVGAAQGASQLVALSIVGLERVPGFGYYQAKLAQEAALRAGPLPVRIVRATQFHEFPAQIMSRAHLGPVAVVPIMRVQPVAARAVGEFLVSVLQDAVPPTTVEVAGPEREDLVALARTIARARSRPTAVVPLPLPGRWGRAMRSGAVLPSSDARVIGPSFEEWLGGDDVAAVLG